MIKKQTIEQIMNLLDHYQQAVLAHDIQDDPLQREVIKDLQFVSNELARTRLFFFLRSKYVPQGLYIYGPVGAGKTYLMDLFYANTQEKRKARFHFHHFMQEIDAQLRQAQGHKNPVVMIARRLARSVRLLCLDEFFVSDVADAMILTTVLQTLFQKGVVIVATSNRAMDDLYEKGVHRERFLPAIALLKQHCRSYALIPDHDYRLGRACVAQTYFYPLHADTEEEFKQHFFYTAGVLIDQQAVLIQNRWISCVVCSASSIWFDFSVLCQIPRCSLDYLEIADRFDCVFVSHVPVFSEDSQASVILFIHFIDVMYDRKIYVVLSSDVALENLYIKGPYLKTFQRTLSRLEEMQSSDYHRSSNKNDS